MKPRPYQQAALDALDAHLTSDPMVNPCIVLPTGAGKSPVMAWAIQRFMREYPPLRVMVLAHVKELVEQNAAKMRAVWPEAPVGIFSAGIGRRDTHKAITFAGIQSVYDKAFKFDPFDLILIDEAHRIPVRGEGAYRRFVKDIRRANPKAVIAGVTATPYRMGVGDICHPDHILHKVIYEANIKSLMRDGYLCPVRNKVADVQVDVEGVRIQNGEFRSSDLSGRVDTDEMVRAALDEALPMLEDRQGIIFFCLNIHHCERVVAALEERGIEAPIVHANTPRIDRDVIVERFKARMIRHVCNVNVFSEGFDAPHVDAVVMMRPTQSKGLYYQQVGRGFRIHPDKQDCIVLDFAGNIDRHGPVDLLAGHRPIIVRCPECHESFSKALRACPACGWDVPPEDRPIRSCPKCMAMNPVSATRCGECGECFDLDERYQSHQTIASQSAILSPDKPIEWEVDRVTVKAHEKPGKPDSLRVTYWPVAGAADGVNEWVCLEHDGFANRRARQWWIRRFGEPVPKSVDEAMGMDGGVSLERDLLEMTNCVRVQREGKYWRIVSCELVNEGKQYANAIGS